MQDISPGDPETPSPFNRSDRCPRCDALAMSWVYVGGTMFLCGECYAELSGDGESVNPSQPGHAQQSQLLHSG
jgi:hypothetical protein